MKISISAGRLFLVVLLLVVATIEIGGCKKDPAPPVPIATPSPPPSKPACDCQLLDVICTLGTSSCVEVECEPSAYKDGKCFLYGGPAVPQPLRTDTGALFGVSFSAYQDAIRAGKASPDASLWEMISKKAPNPDIAHAVTYMTNDFLYIALARDVNALTPVGPGGAMEITAVSDKKATLGLIEAIKAGTILALQKGDPSAINAPISEFFSKNPDFKPVNPGLCYVENNFGSSAECIGTLLEMRLELLVGKE